MFTFHIKCVESENKKTNFNFTKIRHEFNKIVNYCVYLFNSCNLINQVHQLDRGQSVREEHTGHIGEQPGRGRDRCHPLHERHSRERHSVRCERLDRIVSVDSVQTARYHQVLFGHLLQTCRVRHEIARQSVGYALIICIFKLCLIKCFI